MLICFPSFVLLTYSLFVPQIPESLTFSFSSSFLPPPLHSYFLSLSPLHSYSVSPPYTLSLSFPFSSFTHTYSLSLWPSSTHTLEPFFKTFSQFSGGKKNCPILQPISYSFFSPILHSFLYDTFYVQSDSKVLPQYSLMGVLWDQFIKDMFILILLERFIYYCWRN